MNKILDKIGTDKVIHCLVSFVLSVLIALFIKLFTVDKVSIAGLSWMIVFVIGFVKELIDEHEYKGADKDDFIASTIGCTCGSVIIYLLIV